MQTVVYTLSIVIQAIMYSLIGYHFFVSLFAWFPRKEREYVIDKKHTFALFVAGAFTNAIPGIIIHIVIIPFIVIMFKKAGIINEKDN